MAKRISWKPEEFLLVLGLYLKLPFLNGKIPTPSDLVNIIKSKFGIERTTSSIRIRVSNYMSCDPIKISKGIKGLDAGHDQCKPYWDKWADNKSGLLKELNRIISLSDADVSSLSSSSTLNVEQRYKRTEYFSKTELCIAIYFAITRVQATETNPIVKFFSLWFNHKISETINLLTTFTHYLKNDPLPNESNYFALCKNMLAEYQSNPDAITYLGRTVWLDILQLFSSKYPEYISQLPKLMDTILIEKPLNQFIKDLMDKGYSKMDIIKEVMQRFASEGKSLAEWNKIVSDILANNTNHDSIGESCSISSNNDEQPSIDPVKDKSSLRLKIKRIEIEEEAIEGESNPTWMLVNFIKLIGPEEVALMDFPFRGGQLVSKTIHPKYASACKPVGNGYYVNTNSNTPTKIEQIKKIAEYLGMTVNIITDYE
jgi:hypothetical protein